MDNFDIRLDMLFESSVSDKISKLKDDKRKISETKKSLTQQSKNITRQIKQLRIKDLQQKLSECKDIKRASKIKAQIRKIQESLNR